MPPPPPTAPATNTNTLARVPPRPLLDHLPDQDLTSLAQTADAQLRQHFPFSRELLFRELVSSQSRRTLRKLAAQHTAEQILCRSGVREQSTKRAGSYETDAVPLGFELADVAELADKIPYAARYDEKMPGLRRVRAEAWSALLGGAESASALPVPVLADKLVLFNLVVSACVFEVLAVEQEVHINNHYRHMGDEEVDSDDGKFGYADAEQAKYYFGDDNFLHDKDVADARETAISAIEAVRRGIHVLGGGNAGEDAGINSAPKTRRHICSSTESSRSPVRAFVRMKLHKKNLSYPVPDSVWSFLMYFVCFVLQMHQCARRWRRTRGASRG